jgi:hypothetical protein
MSVAFDALKDRPSKKGDPIIIGWHTGHPKEHAKVLAIDAVYWTECLAVWNGYKWYVNSRPVPDDWIALWRPLPKLPERPKDE